MSSRKQQQKNINDTFGAYGHFVDFFRKSLPNSKRSLTTYAGLAASKRSYG